MTTTDRTVAIPAERLAEILKVLELMAAGHTEKRLDISGRHDELDALAHGINVLVSELGWTTARVIEAQEERTVVAERSSAAVIRVPEVKSMPRLRPRPPMASAPMSRITPERVKK